MVGMAVDVSHLKVRVTLEDLVAGMLARDEEAAATGALLRRARETAGMTQAELATALHYSPQHISRWEKGMRCVPQRVIPQVLDVLQEARAHRRRTEQVLREMAVWEDEDDGE